MNTAVILSFSLLWAVVLLNLLISFALVRKVNSITGGSRQFVQPEGLPLGEQIPQFNVVNLDGLEITESDFQDKDKVLVFVSSDCAPCREQIPKLSSLYPKAKNAGIELLIINLEDLDNTKKYAEDFRLDIPIYSAPKNSNSLHQSFKVPGTPSYYFADKTGRIISGGFLDQEWHRLIETW